MKYSIKVNEVRAKEGTISKDLQQWYSVIHLRSPILQSLRIRIRESFSYQCQDTAPMSVMKATV